jgi:hypothetical protein
MDRIRYHISELWMGVTLLPDYMIGYMYRNIYMKRFKKSNSLPWMIQRFITLLEVDDTNTTERVTQ